MRPEKPSPTRITTEEHQGRGTAPIVAHSGSQFVELLEASRKSRSFWRFASDVLWGPMEKGTDRNQGIDNAINTGA
jgi:hypothetical protein